KLRPDFAEAHTGLSLLLLLLGDLPQGWKEYEWRWRTRTLVPRPYPQPLWHGSPLAGKTILLYTEQGYGDTLHFIRYADLLKKRGATVIMESPKPLIPLLSRTPGIDRLIEQGSAPPPFDVHAPLLSLPGALQTTVETIPANIPYLVADPAIVTKWQERLRDLQGFRIGIVWQGNPKHPEQYRFMPLRWFGMLAEVPGVRLVSLQKGAGTEQLADVADTFAVTDLGSGL